jgi:hypothetical protein
MEHSPWIPAKGSSRRQIPNQTEALDGEAEMMARVIRESIQSAESDKIRRRELERLEVQQTEEIRLLEICATSLSQTSRRPHRHILLNSSDIFFTAQAMEFTKIGRHNHALRLTARELALVLDRDERGRGTAESQEGATRLVIGTKPSPTNAIWKHWESAGFEVAVIPSSLGHHEEAGKALADYLVAKTENLIRKRGKVGGEQTLVLCIGKSLERFTEVIRAAVRIG